MLGEPGVNVPFRAIDQSKIEYTNGGFSLKASMLILKILS
jgi:hypothetical protein